VNSSGLGKCTMAGSCECGNEPSDSIKAGYLLTSSMTTCFWRRILLHGLGYLGVLSIIINSYYYSYCTMWEKTIILTAVLWGCKMWSFTLREEHKLQKEE